MSRPSTGLSQNEKKQRRKAAADPDEGIPPNVIVELERKAAATPRDLAYPGGEERLLFKPEVIERTGLSFPTIWGLMRKGEFPRSRIVGGRSAWLSSEIDAWIRRLPVRKLKGDPDGLAKMK
jgi:prophage regulatory protein